MTTPHIGFGWSAALMVGAMTLWSTTAAAAPAAWAEGDALHVKTGADEVVAPLDCETAMEVLQVGWTILVACGKQGVALYDLSRGLELVSRTETLAPCVVFAVEGDRVRCFGSNGATVAAIEGLLKERRGTTYTTKDGAVFATTNKVETPMSTGCDRVSGSVRVGSRLYLACGDGLAVYDTSGDNPILEQRIERECLTLTTSGIDIHCTALAEIAAPPTWDGAPVRIAARSQLGKPAWLFARSEKPEAKRRNLAWVAPVVILGVGTVALFVVAMVAAGNAVVHAGGVSMCHPSCSGLGAGL
jgi:hypothetical protein